MPKIETALDGARKGFEAIDTEMRRRRREDRRRRAVEWTGGIFAFVVVNGLFFILLHKLGIFDLLSDQWGLRYDMSAGIIAILWFGFAFLVASAFFWLSDKTGLHYLVEDWVVSWDTWDAQQSCHVHKYKTFPRRERKTLVRELKKELDVITDNLYHLEMEAEEAFDSKDKRLSESVEEINQIIGSFCNEADFFPRRLISQPKHASWIGFVLTLERTSTDLELELKDIAKYHTKIQPLLKHASVITSKILSRIIDSGRDK